MGDPATIIGGIGFGIQVTEALCKTFGMVEETARVYEECGLRLRIYHRQLKNCKGRVDDWMILWLQKGHFSVEDLKYFWGEEGYEELNLSLKDILNVWQQIQEQIYGKGGKQVDEQTPKGTHRRKLKNKFKGMFHSSNDEGPEGTPSAEDWENWAHFATTLKEAGNKSPETPSFLKRIGFSLYHNKILEDRMKQLDSMTSYLKSQSREEYRRIRRQTTEKEVTVEELKKSKDLQHFTKNLGIFGKEVGKVQQRVGDAGEWSLLLRRPDQDGNAEEWHTPWPIKIKFSLNLSHDARHPASIMVQVHHQKNEHPERCVEKLSRAVHQLTKVEKGRAGERPRQSSPGGTRAYPRRSFSFRTIFDRGFLDDNAAYKAWEPDRARLALEYVNWVLLLWNTPWTINPCSCALRFEEHREGNRIVRRHILSDHCDESCPNSIDPRYRLVFIGVTLAELVIARALRCSVSVPSDDVEDGTASASRDGGVIGVLSASRSHKIPKLVLELSENTPTGTLWRSTDSDHICKRIHMSTGCQAYADAVRYCLEDSLYNDNATLRPDYLHDYISNILRP